MCCVWRCCSTNIVLTYPPSCLLVQVLPDHCGCDSIADFLFGGSEPLPDHRRDGQAEHMAGSSLYHHHGLLDLVLGALPLLNSCVCSGSARACICYL